MGWSLHCRWMWCIRWNSAWKRPVIAQCQFVYIRSSPFHLLFFFFSSKCFGFLVVWKQEEQAQGKQLLRPVWKTVHYQLLSLFILFVLFCLVFIAGLRCLFFLPTIENNHIHLWQPLHCFVTNHFNIGYCLCYSCCYKQQPNKLSIYKTSGRGRAVLNW